MAHIPAQRCLSIIELLVREGGDLQLGDLAGQLNLPKSGVHRLLGALIEQGWVEQDPNSSAYRLTMRLTILGQSLFNATGIPDICQPVLDGLAVATGEFVRLAVIDAHALVWVADAQGTRGGLMYQPLLSTNTAPLHATASGKCWLAGLDAAEVRDLIERNGGFGEPGQYGPNTVRSFEQLFAELQRTRDRGYGLAISEAEAGITAVAALVVAGGKPVGSVSVAGPSIRMGKTRLPDVARLMTAAARELSSRWPFRRQASPTRLLTSSMAAR